MLESDERPDVWQAECEKAVRVMLNLLHLAGRKQTASAVLELVRTAPRTPEEIANASVSSLFCRSVFEANEWAAPCDKRMFDEVRRYINYLAEMSPSRRSLLEASVAGALLGWGMGGS